MSSVTDSTLDTVTGFIWSFIDQITNLSFIDQITNLVCVVFP
jgi:hypothetical protein